MFFQSSRGIVWSSLLIFLLAASTFGQDTVVASVNNIEVTQKQVDESVATRIYPLQQQLYAIRKAALENLVTAKILESEAAASSRSVRSTSRARR